MSIDYEDMPALYNRYQAVVVDPIVFHAFGRIVAEAMACGCNVLASARVGAISWPDPLAATQDANKKFWSVVVRGTTLSAFRGWFRTSGRARTQHTSGLNESGKPQTKAVA